MGAGGHAPETAARILEGSRVTIRVPASDNTYEAPGVKGAKHPKRVAEAAR